MLTEAEQTNKSECYNLDIHVPKELQNLPDLQRDIPRIAKDTRVTSAIELAACEVPTNHDFHLGDSRKMDYLAPESVHLVVTSPPYWNLKEYRNTHDQLGMIDDYELFLLELDCIWKQCYRALAPGGRLVCVVGDVCLSRRNNNGRHTVVPLHASIQVHCREIGFDNLSPIIWNKISNAAYEVQGSGGFLGKPYEPNSVIKNDIEYILMQRKPGGYRKPTFAKRVLSVIPAASHQKWFQQIWTGVTGASTRNHPAPYPIQIAKRLIRMFSFVGDTVLDPFHGTGSTSIAAAHCGRNSIGVEIDPVYFESSCNRFMEETASIFSKSTLNIIKNGKTH